MPPAPTSTRLRGRTLAPRASQRRYSGPYAELVNRAALSVGLDPFLLAGLLSVETGGFDPDVVYGRKDSPAGAVGIAQIHAPSHPDVSRAQATDPDFAIPWAARYLARLRDAAGGSISAALRAYNTGRSSRSSAGDLYVRQVTSRRRELVREYTTIGELGDWRAWVGLPAKDEGPSQPHRPEILEFVGRIGRLVRQKLTPRANESHSLTTVDGRPSAHAEGWAADIPAAGAQLTRLGQAALIAAGAKTDWARAQSGGLFNVGDYQVIFNTNEGGNHYGHLHVGLQADAQRPDPRLAGVDLGGGLDWLEDKLNDPVDRAERELRKRLREEAGPLVDPLVAVGEAFRRFLRDPAYPLLWLAFMGVGFALIFAGATRLLGRSGGADAKALLALAARGRGAGG